MLLTIQTIAARTFPATLTNDDRAVVHGLCRKYGMKSKSHGCAVHLSTFVQCSARERVGDRSFASADAAPPARMRCYAQLRTCTLECRNKNNRVLTIYKPDGQAAVSDAYALPLSVAAQAVLQQHFTQFPPGQEEFQVATETSGNMAVAELLPDGELGMPSNGGTPRQPRQPACAAHMERIMQLITASQGWPSHASIMTQPDGLGHTT